MKLGFCDIKNAHKGKPALILAHGPSLNPYIPKLQSLRDNGMILIGCNEWYWIYDTAPDYWVLANSVLTMQNQIDKIRPLTKTKIAYADTVDRTNKQWVDAEVKCDYLPYDQRHFGQHPCGQCIPNCNTLIPHRKTIQEELMVYTGHDKHYGAGDTVALHCMTMGILMGCNPIYIVGMELDYRLGYANNVGGLNADPNIFDDVRQRILDHIVIVRDSAAKIGVKIINLNKNSKFKELEVGELPPPAASPESESRSS